MRRSLLRLCVAVGFILTLLQTSHAAHRQVITSHHTTRSSSPWDLTSSVGCLTTTIYHEARGKKLSTQVKIGRVVLKRTKMKEFPHTVCGVVKQKTRLRHAHHKTVCQFSWYCKMSRHPVINSESLIAAKFAAYTALRSGPTPAVFFNSLGSCPRKTKRHIEDGMTFCTPTH